MLRLNVRGANRFWSLFILLENVNFWFSSIEQIWGFCDNKPRKTTKPNPSRGRDYHGVVFDLGMENGYFFLSLGLGFGIWELGLVVLLLLLLDLDLSSSSSHCSSLFLLHPVCFFTPLLQFHENSSSTWIILSISTWKSKV